MVYCTNCGLYFEVKFLNGDKKLSEDDVKHCPKCGKEIVPEKVGYGCLIFFLSVVLAAAFVFTVFGYLRSRDNESSEAEAVSVNYTTLADQWELEEEDEFDWDEI